MFNRVALYRALTAEDRHAFRVDRDLSINDLLAGKAGTVEATDMDVVGGVQRRRHRLDTLNDDAVVILRDDPEVWGMSQSVRTRPICLRVDESESAVQVLVFREL